MAYQPATFGAAKVDPAASVCTDVGAPALLDSEATADRPRGTSATVGMATRGTPATAPHAHERRAGTADILQ